MIVRIEKRFITCDMLWNQKWLGDQLRLACEEYAAQHQYTIVKVEIENRFEEISTNENVFILRLEVKQPELIIGGI